MTLESIRRAEAKSHTEIYSNHRLLHPGSWLHKPVQTVMDILPSYQNATKFCCLDLGCGIGRNCIPIAQAFACIDCSIDCVDILPIAINQLLENAEAYRVQKHIHGIVSAIEDYPIDKNSYDLILGVSALEHCKNPGAFLATLHRIKEGICPGGIVCLIINSSVREHNSTTGEELEPQFEVNFNTGELTEILNRCFSEWDILKYTIVHQQYAIPRDCISVNLDTDVVTFVARK